MTKISTLLRTSYAVCLLAATFVHVGTHFKYGITLGALGPYGYSAFTRAYWTSLTLLDPCAAVLLFTFPRGGLALTTAVIVSDVAHNAWLLGHLGVPPDVLFWLQVTFLVFVLVTIRFAWRGCVRSGLPPAREQSPD